MSLVTCMHALDSLHKVFTEKCFWTSYRCDSVSFDSPIKSVIYIYESYNQTKVYIWFALRLCDETYGNTTTYTFFFFFYSREKKGLCCYYSRFENQDQNQTHSSFQCYANVFSLSSVEVTVLLEQTRSIQESSKMHLRK